MNAAACMCSDPECRLYGCKAMRVRCCPPGQYSAPPRGCICPPGAEATCQGLGCPRKSFGNYQVGGEAK